MLQNWFILLPEICMLSFFLVAWPVELYRQEKTAKTFFTLAQFFLLAVMFCSVVFYNKSAFPKVWQNTPFTTLFKSFVYLLAWAWFYLSSKWFLNKNRPSFKFYAICFAMLFGFSILASASSLLTLAMIVPYICFFYYLLILRHWDTEKVAPIARVYAVCSALFCLILWGGVALIYFKTGAFDYAAVLAFFNSHQPFDLTTLTSVLLVLSCLIFLMGLVPFHTWFIAFISNGVLPVCGFITLIPPLIYLCTLINLMHDCFFPFIGFVAPVIASFAGLSLVIGALSANREDNIRRLFAYLTIYCFGFTLLGLTGFSNNAIIASFAYTVIAVLSLAGVYTVFLGMKSRGEYLSEISAINGFYQQRPYMSAALLVFMFSLIGLAPTLGFFGYLSIINNLVAAADWGRVALLLGSLLFVASACLQIIRTIYFEPLADKYDRTDKAIYICLFINVALILISLVNPAWLIHDALVILGGIS